MFITRFIPRIVVFHDDNMCITHEYIDVFMYKLCIIGIGGVITRGRGDLGVIPSLMIFFLF